MWTIQSRESGWSFSNNALEEISNEIDEGWEKRVHTSKLEEYVVQRRNDNRLVEEFESITNERLYACKIATLKENKRKNRYENILPYDHTRVILDVLPNDSYSDYINANYINGYKIEKKYIATQGPTPLRMVDFWRMVWQVKCSKIVMITNLVENGETKCKKYWPKKTDTYGNLKVQLMDQDVYADFTIRTFLISKDNEINQVKQFHFTTWSQKSIPLYTSSLLIFIGKIRDYQPPNQGPIIVHSSAGVGRTGAFILLDYMMDMIQWEEHVNLPKCVREIRHQRMNMVETAEQYIFIYETILDALWPFNTSIPPKNFPKWLCELKSVDPYTGLTYIENEFKRLNRMYPRSTENLFNTFSSFESIKRSNMGSLHVDVIEKRKLSLFLRFHTPTKLRGFGSLFVTPIRSQLCC
ncbi:receptor-type tyrosine-protein phosphatase T-like isoform X5 [Centruroides vittatus]